jgi:pimeloyl-ACP methyl ester carboxylesterase
MIVDTLATYATNLKAEVLGYDYTGYGPDQTEQPSEEACYQNMQDVLDYLKAVGVETTDIVLIGRSLGSGPPCHAAAQYAFAGVVLEAPFLSPILTKFPFTIRFLDIFHNVSKVGDFACPVMIIHGDNDRVVPYSNGAKLFAALREDARHKFITLEGAGHNNMFSNIANLNSYLQDIRLFVQSCTLAD